mmetsp:Transcript_96262/g.267499  ORF Transcript_96262/g.267499 Transcript_96262/m.267499 type:complete len:227 (-) Transcript_96262:757-1437(-)
MRHQPLRIPRAAFGSIVTGTGHAIVLLRLLRIMHTVVLQQQRRRCNGGAPEAHRYQAIPDSRSVRLVAAADRLAKMYAPDGAQVADILLEVGIPVRTTEDVLPYLGLGMVPLLTFRLQLHREHVRPLVGILREQPQLSLLLLLVRLDGGADLLLQHFPDMLQLQVQNLGLCDILADRVLKKCMVHTNLAHQSLLSLVHDALGFANLLAQFASALVDVRLQRRRLRQ